MPTAIQVIMTTAFVVPLAIASPVVLYCALSVLNSANISHSATA